MKNKKLKVVKEKTKEQINLFIRNSDFTKNDLNSSRIEIIGNSEMFIDACKGVLEYGDELVALKVLKGTVTVIGERLNLINFSDNSVLIRGIITDIRFNI